MNFLPVTIFSNLYSDKADNSENLACTIMKGFKSLYL